MTVQVKRRRFTADEYERMGEAGILHEDERVELIDGEIVEMAAIGSRHVACVNRYTRMFFEQARGRFIVSVQNPVRLSSYAEPEPDIALLRPRPDDYASALPGPVDVLLIVEVADTSFEYDQEIKLARYAEAAIPEVWLTDLRRDLVLVHRHPESGQHREVTIRHRGDVLVPETLPDIAVPVDTVLPATAP